MLAHQLKERRRVAESRYPATLLQYNLARFDHPLRG
jgi:hypothetical protein